MDKLLCVNPIIDLFGGCGGGDTAATIKEKAVSNVLNEAVSSNIMECIKSSPDPGGENLVHIDFGGADNVVIDDLNIFQKNTEAVSCYYKVTNQQKISDALQQRLTAMAQASGANISGGMGALFSAGITGKANVSASEVANITQRSIINNIQKCAHKVISNIVDIEGSGAGDIVLENVNIHQDASTIIHCGYSADNMQDLLTDLQQIEKATAAAGKAASKGKLTGIFRVVVVVAVVVAALALMRIIYGKYKQYKAKKEKKSQGELKPGTKI